MSSLREYLKVYGRSVSKRAKEEKLQKIQERDKY